MFTISAFADEISPDPQTQIDVLNACAVRHIEFRSILQTNVLALSDLQITEFKSLIDANGFKLSAIGSPLGKIRIDEPFEPHLQKLHRAIHLCKVFGTPNIRIFSYYPPENFDGDWTNIRPQIMDRMTRKLEIAAKAGVRLVHENEHRIYGEAIDHVVDLMTTLSKWFDQKAFGAVYDAANYVYGAHDPWDGWVRTRDYTVHLHIKDWKHGEPHGSIAGEGQGQIPRSIADAVQRGYTGFATMEPHLLGGGPTGGVTGPDLFRKAVAAFKKILDDAGAKHQ
ncbi:MAG: sugar phosphate isomerase/epimerase [Gemmataceae bacterium]|nr:sugar phosphate isomerase/epimerase [Gemmataceae bacterium]